MIERTITSARAALDRYGVEDTDTVVVGCSGGPDSAVLADVVMTLARRGRLRPVTLLYVDHGLRPGSARDGDLVARLAAAGGASVRIEAVAVDRARASLEDAARRARYGAFERVADELGARWVLLGHTATDQAETVLMRIVRGTGVAGLAGIPWQRDRYLRPLLGVSREEIEAYAAARGLETAADPMNDDQQFLRNRVRRSLLPALRSENPSADEALRRLADAAGEQREVLDYAAAQLVSAARRGGAWSAQRLAEAPRAVAKRAISLILATATDAEVGEVHLEAVRSLCEPPRHGSSTIDLPGLQVLREYDELRLLTSPNEQPGPRLRANSSVSVSGMEGPYAVRTWQSGDRMRPERLAGRSAKLSDLFAAAQVPARLRPSARVVVRQSDGLIVWAEHLGPAHGCSIQVTLTCPDLVASNKC
ncbi:MAG TPA: tRNA lysidine(34) synthetase TilS [Kofleriaceae bacterium]|nr:tRNA lysidine(34) synthetase TilS [Kofleriaceae bacterium]